MKKIRTNIINSVTPDRVHYLSNHILSWEDGVIHEIRPYQPALDGDAIDASDSVMLPGFIDLHVHLSQHHARGLYEAELLPWLQRHIFPAEALSADADYASKIAQEFFKALFASGTSTAVIYTAPFVQSCETAFEEAIRVGARGLIGMTLMDTNSPPQLQQSTEAAFTGSVSLYEKYHAANPLLDYIFSPRFAISCSEELMRLIGRFAQKHDAYIQSHLSENKDEIAWVQQIFGKKSYTEVYDECGILGDKTIMAHAIHLSPLEVELLKESGTAIAHCPDSNFFLKSGEFPYNQLWEEGLRIGIGSDVGAGSTLSMPYHAKMMAYRQSETQLSPQRQLWHITLGAAEALSWQHRIGSLECGKEADFCLLPIPSDCNVDDTLLSRLFYLQKEFEVLATVIHGRTVYLRQNTYPALEG
ncbi:MAG: amidohydrolase family protein [Candidatus Cloacimonetes bacterium]|nr:amidohydrolase family protein [Candidatus Cloacimonadota bacterium]